MFSLTLPEPTRHMYANDGPYLRQFPSLSDFSESHKKLTESIQMSPLRATGERGDPIFFYSADKWFLIGAVLT